MQIWQRLVELETSGSDFGLKWPNSLEILAQIESECQEIREHLQAGDSTSRELQDEIGDLMHAVMSLSWYCGFNSKTILTRSCDKFESRLNMMKQIVQEQGLPDMKNKSFAELMQVWDEAKLRLTT